MIVKQCQFAGRDENGIYLHILHPGYDDTAQLIKTAASPPLREEIRHFLKAMDRSVDSTTVLMSALGAFEYWGDNSNADRFPERALIHTPQGWDSLDAKMRRIVGPEWEWGYPTFYGAKPYQHHQNKDPSRAFGEVIYATWDPIMRRVLLVVRFDHAKAREMGAIAVVDRVNNGEYPSVSMGCKVPFDLCSVCTDWKRITGNPKKDLAEHKRSAIRGLSVTTSDYCQHLKFEAGKIYPDGRRVAMWNLHPKFFDISIVYIGADKTSYILAKLAGECPIRPGHKQCSNGCWECAVPSGHIHEVWSREPQIEKTASVHLPLNKRAEIIKRIQSQFNASLPSLTSREPDLPKSVLDTMSDRPADAMATAGGMGIVLRPREFQRVYIRSIGQPDLADDLDRLNVCFPTGAPPADDFSLSGTLIPKLVAALLPHVSERSALGPVLRRRITIVAVKSPRQDSLVPIEHPLLDKVASAYSAYRRDVVYKATSLVSQLLHEHPEVLPEIYGEVFEPGALVKTGGDMFQSLLGMLPATYLNRAYLSGPVSGYVESNIGLRGLREAAALAACGV